MLAHEGRAGYGHKTQLIGQAAQFQQGILGNPTFPDVSVNLLGRCIFCNFPWSQTAVGVVRNGRMAACVLR